MRKIILNNSFYRIYCNHCSAQNVCRIKCAHDLSRSEACLCLLRIVRERKEWKIYLHVEYCVSLWAFQQRLCMRLIANGQVKRKEV